MLDEEHRHHVGNLTPGTVALLKQVADETSERTVRRWMTVMGLDPDNPIEAQSDFVTLRKLRVESADEETAADKAWLRRTRQLAQGLVGKIAGGIALLVVASAAQSMWVGFKDLLGVAHSAAPPHS